MKHRKNKIFNFTQVRNMAEEHVAKRARDVTECVVTQIVMILDVINSILI